MDAPAFPFQGPGTKDDILIEIFASRSNSQISALNEAYLQGEHGGGGSLPNRFICSVTRPSPSHPCLCHRKGEEVDLWSKEGSLRGLLKSSAPPRRGLSGCCYRRFHHIRSCDAHQSQEPATRVLLNLGDVVKWFSWFLKGKREESAAVDQAKAKEDAKVQDERSGSVCFYGWANFKSSFSLVDPL